MVESISPIKHRLELLERTLYAVQAQHRLLEYRVQYIEDENQTLRQALASSLQQGNGPGNGKASSGHNSYISELQALAKEPEDSVDEHVKTLSSLSLLDAPTLLMQVLVPKTTAKSEVRYSPLAPSSAAASEFEPSGGSRFNPPTVDTLPLVSGSPESSAVDTSSNPKTKERDFAVVPWDGTIAWKFINLFRDKREEHEAILNSIDHCRMQDEWFFQYGLRYIPKPGDKDAYRTVRIENLPNGTTLDELLAHIHCGDVFSADLLNTLSITGYHTGRVVFLHQKSAEKFCRSVKKRGLEIQGTPAHVTLEKTATYPVGMSLRAAIRDHGCTRCVLVDEVPEALIECIDGVVGTPHLKNSVEHYSRSYCDEEYPEQTKLRVCVRFHSMRAAAYAYDELQRNIFLRHCILTYDKDPCNSEPM
ncbi:conserved hypothetical protein [Talaromyces stipitatus ATCC 10500]|uniref:RRM domain-containing protein n=1 Tax=Talaromyces stipitatus (strain ATCC 10500 / CBS 375.48 / QM 6759 / NRRL 1006) TaxID=441959 RepID=B8MB07_TALSN|nr:uncharacterized protein TSTA_124320 [Talaromyces stipitatus ATCC 10500]EED18708.1 conserved hypothetical protein [Talaromyces stipitatus ATCC 10500]